MTHLEVPHVLLNNQPRGPILTQMNSVWEQEKDVNHF